MNIYMLRHGETEWNTKLRIQGQTDTELNENGINQAIEAGEELKNMHLKVDRIFSSPQKRAWTTAIIIGEKLAIECEKVEGLQEICFGKWEGLTWEQVENEFPDEYHYWHENRRTVSPPGGESYQQLLKRTVTALKQIIDREDKDCIVVAHSAVIMTLRCFLDDAPFHEMVKRYRTKNAGIFTFQSEDLLNRIENSL